MSRTKLPNFRLHDMISFKHENIQFDLGIGRLEERGPIVEVWLNALKSGSAIDMLVRDWAKTFSLYLQEGDVADSPRKIAALKKTVSRTRTGGAVGAIAHAVDLLAKEGQ